MARKKYDDEKLKAEMVALRRQGFSYRQIARQLGCSIYKVYELLSPDEKLNTRLKQAFELTEKLGKIEAEAKALEGRLVDLAKRMAELNVLDDLKTQVSRLNTQLRQLNINTFALEEKLKCEANELRSQIQKLSTSQEEVSQRLSQLETTISRLIPENEGKTLNLEVRLNALQNTLSVRSQDLWDRITNIENTIQWIYRSSTQKVEGKKACKHIDKEGYCKQTIWRNKPQECRTKQIIINGQTFHILNVRDNPLICIACPSYKPK